MAHRLGDQRAKRLLLTGDCITGAQAAEWGLAVEAPDPADLDERTERLVERIAAVPVNQLIMVKLAMNSALLQQGVATSRMVSTVFDGIARHHTRRHAFVADAVEHGFPARPSGTATNLLATTAAPRQESDVSAEPISRLTARSVVLSVLLGAHPAWATAGELVRLTADFDIKGSHASVALTRMVAAGDLGPVRGRLSALGPPAEPAAAAGCTINPRATALERNVTVLRHHDGGVPMPGPGRYARGTSGPALR